MLDRLVSSATKLGQQPAYLPFTELQLLGRLPLPNRSARSLFQCHQPIPVGLGHQQFSCFCHSPASNLSIGHFYFAQLGHSYVAATR
jgi:hypothetical protein